MGIRSRCLNICNRVQSQGLQRTVRHHLNRKKERERLLQTVQEYHLLSETELERQRRSVLEYQPLISIITPLYNTPEKFLRQMLESVQGQTYGNWELCLADGSDKEHAYVERICSDHAKADSRIVYKKLKKNRGIVGNTNACIELASGEYYGLLDHDDLLHASALFEAAKAIAGDADFIYTDEMKFQDSVEQSVDIVCKNDFGRDELRSHNYICHFVVFKKSLLDEMGELYRERCEGSQDYDMALRLTEKAERVVHIPRILYYWRVHQGSVSMNLSGKQYAVDAAKRAISEQMERCMEPGIVECNYPYETIYRLKYKLKERSVVSVILWGDRKNPDLGSYIGELLAKTSYRPLELVLPYEESSITKGLQVKVSSEPTGDYLLFLNLNCMPVNASWIEELLMFAQRDDVGAAGPHIVHKKQKTYFAGGVLDAESSSGIHVINQNMDTAEQGYEANMKHVRNTTILTMLCMMVSRKAYEELGGFDMQMGACRDADFCLRSRQKGKNNVWTCFSKVYYSGTPEAIWKECRAFKEKWETLLKKGDGYYHPLLKKLTWM